ncbi:uncharacterized protein LOC143470198 isoform X4 [Clavelina lepadiformis]|uniref:uncharacterized protein LOC143470198 isoform X4 n=1 Tax=Clavelina lepadiformis TaxID=159417 RepID=UPI00404387AE
MRSVLSVLLLSCTLLSVYGRSVFEMDRCSDVSFACKNFNTAKSCGKIQLCKTEYWSRASKNDEFCVLCKDAVEGLASYLKENGTKEKIENALMKICASVPLTQLATECKQVVSEDFDMLYDEIIDLIQNGDLVCGALGLCSSYYNEDDFVQSFVQHLPRLLKDAIKKNQLPVAVPEILPLPAESTDQSEDDSCSDCEAFLKDVQSAVKNNDKIVDEWKKMVKTECDALGSNLDEACKLAVDDFFPKALDALTGNNAPTICSAMMMCGFKKSQSDSNNRCTDCKNFINDWQNYILNNQTIVDQLNQVVLGECKNLQGLDKLNDVINNVASFYCLQKPDYLQRECTKYVAIVLRNNLKRIAQKTPDAICSAIDFCDEDDTEEENNIISVAEMVPPVQGDYCTDCTTFMTDLQGVAKNNQSIINDLTDLVKEQCDQLGPELSGLCRLQVPSEFATLLPQFEKADVNTICTTILMCPSSTPAPMPNGDLCSDCTVFFKDWQEIIANNKSKIRSLVDGEIENFCNQIPFFGSECRDSLDKFADEQVDLIIKTCDAFVKEYLPQLWDLISYNDAEQICSTLYLCGAAEDEEVAEEVVADPDETEEENNNISVAEMVPPVQGDYCTDCTTFMKDLQGVAKNNQSIIDDLTDLVKEECDQLGPELSAICKQVPTALHNLLPQFEILDVNTICSAILMCTSSTPAPTPNGDLCSDCTAFTKDWQEIIANNQSTIKQLLSQEISLYCNQIPFFESECRDKLDTVADNLIALLAKNDAEQICSTLYMCGAAVEEEVEEENLLPASQIDETVQDKVSDPVSCAVCRVAVHELDRLLQGNKTEAAVIAALDKVCNIAPVDIRKECQIFIDKYGKDVVDLIINEVESGIICSTLMLCSSQKVGLVQLKKPVVVGASVGCELCMTVIEELDHVLDENSTEEEIVKAVEKVCTILPSQYQGECDLLIEQYGDDIIHLLPSLLDPQAVCSTLGLCTKSKAAVPRKYVGATEQCSLCQYVAKELDKLLKESSTEAEIIDAVQKVCTLIPSGLKTQCDDFIQSAGPTFIKLLSSEIKPNTLCALIKLCPQKVTQVSVEDSEGCELCKLVIGELDNFLDENSTEEEIVKAVEKVCTILPSQYQSECDSLIEQYGEEIVSILPGLLDPVKVCATLGLCSAKTKVSVEDPETCELCKLVIKELDNYLDENSTEEEIVKAVEKVCTILPSQYQSECDSLIEQYGEQIVSMLPGLLDPVKVCATLGLCSAKMAASPKSIDVSAECELCQYVAKELDSLLTENSTEEEIINAVGKVCSLLPGDLKSQCDDFIQSVGPTLIRLLLNEFTPDSLCAEIKLCPKNVAVSSDVCDICRIAIDFLGKEISSNATEEEIQQTLDGLCDKLPKSIQSECDGIVAQYTPEIVKLVQKTLDPDYVCIHLDLCKNGNKKSPRLGVNPCTYGPSYWCKNEQTAKECNAVTHCKRHVWD